jgi:N-acetylglutamate synthase-like GNAT family acetyltransferase
VTTGDAIAVGPLEAAASKDAGLVDELAGLINGVYATAESGMWREGATRTTSAELADMVAARQIVVARRDGRIVGSVRFHDVADDLSEFGLLVADPEERGTGVGRALLDYAELDSSERGLRAIQLELLVPRAWRHPSKEFLKGWYGRRGYRIVRTTSIDDAYPHLAPLLATACDLEIHQKPLVAP